MGEHTGFYRETTDFLFDLRENNTKAWFEANRENYEKYLITPARHFVSALGEKLIKIAPGIHAEPRVDKSIFRLNRDLRFSRDKKPYKFHLGIFLWEGERPKLECSGFYFELKPEEFVLGTGVYQFPKPVLQEFRRSVTDEKLGMDLVKAIQAIPQKEMNDFGGEHYKKIPAGYDPDHFNSDFLKYNGLYTMVRNPVTDLVFSSDFADFCAKTFADAAPLHYWLRDMIARAKE